MPVVLLGVAAGATIKSCDLGYPYQIFLSFNITVLAICARNPVPPHLDFVEPVGTVLQIPLCLCLYTLNHVLI